MIRRKRGFQKKGQGIERRGLKGFKIRKREKKNKKRIKNCEMAGAGSYSEGYGTQAPGPGSHPSMCRKCPSGYSCSSGKKEKCGKGKTSQEGDGACSPCPKVRSCSFRWAKKQKKRPQTRRKRLFCTHGDTFFEKRHFLFKNKYFLVEKTHFLFKINTFNYIYTYIYI